MRAVADALLDEELRRVHDAVPVAVEGAEGLLKRRRVVELRLAHVSVTVVVQHGERLAVTSPFAARDRAVAVSIEVREQRQPLRLLLSRWPDDPQPLQQARPPPLDVLVAAQRSVAVAVVAVEVRAVAVPFVT